MAEWYYTTNKQQMGPVTQDELRQLANKGLLKPTDLVWKDGMKDWARASSQDLFTDGGRTVAPDLAPAPRRSSRLVEDAEDDDQSRRRAPRYEDDDDDAYDERPRRRRRARHRDDGMPVGLRVGLIVGGVVTLLLVVGVALFFLLRTGDGGQVAAGMGNFNGVLGPNDGRDVVRGGPCRVYNVRMVQGRTYVIDLRSGQFDSFLRLEDSAFRQMAQDDDSGGGLNARIIFRCPRTDNYRVIATTFGPGQGAYTLSIREN